MEKNDVGLSLNQLARKKMIYKLLQDIRVDIEVCKLEGFDYKPYLLEIKEIIDKFLKDYKVKNYENRR